MGEAQKQEAKRLAYEILENLGDLGDINLGRVGKFDPTALRRLYEVVYESVKDVESVSKIYGSLTGEEKKEVVVEILNESVNIPWFPEFLERVIFGLLIDIVVYVFNKIGGHDWLNNLFNK